MMNCTLVIALLPMCCILACGPALEIMQFNCNGAMCDGNEDSVGQGFELLPAPENVTLVSEDFYSFLTWTTHRNSGPAEYDIEIIDRGYGSGPKYKNWTRVNKTCEVIGSFWKCGLSSYFNDPHLIYSARVRAVSEGYTSDWTISKDLQHYKDVTLGPPEITLLIHNQMIQVTVATRISPLQNESGVFLRVNEVLNHLRSDIIIYEEQREVDQHRAAFDNKMKPYISNRSLKTNTLYCALVTIKFDHKSANATQCIITPLEPSGFLHIALSLTCPALLFCILVLYLFIKHVNPDSSKTPLPRVLQEFVTEDLGLYHSSKFPHNEEKVDLIFMCPLHKPSHEDDFEREIEFTSTEQMFGEYDFPHDTGFQSKGFGKSYCDSEAYSDTKLSLLSTSDDASGDRTSSAAGLLENDFHDSSPSEVHISVHHQIHSQFPPSMSEGCAGHMVQSTGTEAVNLQSRGNVGTGRYQDTERTQQYKLNIPLHSVMLQACVESIDLQAQHEFYDIASDESSEGSSLGSQSVGSIHEGRPQHNHNITNFSGDMNHSGYESRPFIIHAEMEDASVYQLREYAADS